MPCGPISSTCSSYCPFETCCLIENLRHAESSWLSGNLHRIVLNFMDRFCTMYSRLSWYWNQDHCQAGEGSFFAKNCKICLKTFFAHWPLEKQLTLMYSRHLVCSSKFILEYSERRLFKITSWNGWHDKSTIRWVLDIKIKLKISFLLLQVTHCGGVGTGGAVKICNNMLLAISMIGTSETMNLGIR
jgi:hypothetical protein